MIVIHLLLLILLCPHTAEADARQVRLEITQVNVGDQVMGVEQMSSFQEVSVSGTKRLDFKEEKKVYDINAEVFQVRVQVSNYSKENFTINPDGYLQDGDWLVEGDSLSVGMMSEPCQPDADGNTPGKCGGAAAEVVPARTSSGWELLLSLTEKTEPGETDVVIGLRTHPDEGGERVLRALPLRLNFSSTAVNGFREKKAEIRDWQDQQAGMRSEQKSGVIQRLFPNGKVWIEESYVDGKMEGTVKTYCDNGVLKERLNYQADRLDGEARYYDCNKEMRKVVIYRAGEILGYTEFSPFDSRQQQQRKIEELTDKVQHEGQSFPVVVF